MVIFPKAKINIGLRIIRKRSDGFHDIETVFYPVGLRDALEFVVPDEHLADDNLTVTGLLTGCNPDDNIVKKAVTRFRQHYEIPFMNLHLHKAIPVGAGLGGGSSDAATLLKCLDSYFNAGLEKEGIKELASGLGSDCAFFIEGKPSFADGRGERLQALELNLDGYYIILVNPGIHVSTREAYENCVPHIPESRLNEDVLLPVSEWRDLIVNDFESTVFARHPEIKRCKEDLYNIGAAYSSMSGSGSTVYGIFNEEPVIPESMVPNVIYSGIL